MKIQMYTKQKPIKATNTEPVEYEFKLEAEGLDHEIKWLEHLINEALWKAN